jgi:hypothetical protein
MLGQVKYTLVRAHTSPYLHQLLKARALLRSKEARVEVVAIPIIIRIIRVYRKYIEV